MACPECGSEAVVFSVPEDARAALPEPEPTLALCTRCLHLEPTEEPAGKPDFTRVSDAFPSGRDGSIRMAVLLGLLENLALYRSEITTLLASVERSGTDPLLVLDRLAHDPDIETDLDLSGRRRQLEQLL